MNKHDNTLEEEELLLNSKYTLLFRSYLLISLQFCIYTVFIMIFSQVDEISNWVQNPDNSWFYITFSAVSWGFLLLGHILMRFKKLDESFKLDAFLFLVITITMAIWVGAASAFHQNLTQMFVFSCWWCFGFVMISLQLGKKSVNF